MRPDAPAETTRRDLPQRTRVMGRHNGSNNSKKTKGLAALVAAFTETGEVANLLGDDAAISAVPGGALHPSQPQSIREPFTEVVREGPNR